MESIASSSRATQPSALYNFNRVEIPLNSSFGPIGNQNKRLKTQNEQKRKRGSIQRPDEYANVGLGLGMAPFSNVGGIFQTKPGTVAFGTARGKIMN